MPNESLEEKVERLELYITLLRQIAVDPEEYRLWDWVIANELNVDQYNSIKNVLKLCVRANLAAEKDPSVKIPTLEELVDDLVPILSPNPRIAHTKGVIELLRNAVKMTPYLSLQKYL
ncbi:DUF1878 family protein [Paenibacillus xylanexedens]|uniref:DUF1878 domain-containing protein n=1 Tax=Paenibacillus xylanexedens TaxID=528191 RepID=A0ABS4S3W6_PAEXY|nr:DUF1878 family protein [Paenibacillus xylanexedens]MBP2249269.1 hypothetical protein [Paenibacillus xylanexedens]